MSAKQKKRKGRKGRNRLQHRQYWERVYLDNERKMTIALNEADAAARWMKKAWIVLAASRKRDGLCPSCGEPAHGGGPCIFNRVRGRDCKYWPKS